MLASEEPVRDVGQGAFESCRLRVLTRSLTLFLSGEFIEVWLVRDIWWWWWVLMRNGVGFFSVFTRKFRPIRMSHD